MLDRAARTARRADPPRPNGVPRPFLKWAGGKRQLVPELLRNAPARFNTYHEPFVGGGALFFALAPRRAVLYDNNLRLIRTWRAIRDDVEAVIARLRSYPHDKAFFLEMRERDIDREADAEVAAWLIYLNRTAYNGLYRVNRRNVFNVPFGRYSAPTICDAENLRACSRALQGVRLLHTDFTSALELCERGDFVYFDPPYAPLSPTSSFTAYTADGFGPEEQIRLRDTALALKRRGVDVLLSNSASKFVREIYAEGFEVEEVLAMRAINCHGERRGQIAELIIR